MTAVILICLVAGLPGFFSIPPVDRDEPLFAQASKQMVASRDFVDIRFQEEPRYKKPIGIYWVQSAFAYATGYGSDAPIWVYRLPSLLAGLLSAFLIFSIGRTLFDLRIGLAAALIFPLLILSTVEARLAKTDMVMLVTLLASVLSIARFWLKKPIDEDAYIFWITIAIGVLVKGPIVPMIAGLMIAALCLWSGQWRWIRPIFAAFPVCVGVAIALPWFVAIGYVSDGNFYRQSLGGDLFAKVASGVESHGAPPGTYFVAMLVTFWPASAYLADGLKGIRERLKEPATRFLLAWIVPAWIIFELIPTKLPHYILVVYPALVLLILAGLFRNARTNAPPAGSGNTISPLRRGLYILNRSLLFIIPAGVTMSIYGLSLQLGDQVAYLAVFICAIATVLGIFAIGLLNKRKGQRSIALAGLSAVFLYLGVYQFGFPNLSKLWIAPRISEAADQLLQCERGVLYMAGYYEPSLIFLSKHRVARLDSVNHDDIKEDCAVYVIEKRKLSQFQELNISGTQAQPAAVLEGVNLNGGKELTFHLFRQVKN